MRHARPAIDVAVADEARDGDEQPSCCRPATKRRVTMVSMVAALLAVAGQRRHSPAAVGLLAFAGLVGGGRVVVGLAVPPCPLVR